MVLNNVQSTAICVLRYAFLEWYPVCILEECYENREECDTRTTQTSFEILIIGALSGGSTAPRR